MFEKIARAPNLQSKIYEFGKEIYLFAEKIYQLKFLKNDRNTLTQLDTSPYPQGAKIAEALRGVQTRLAPSDRDWIEKIEAERKRLFGKNEYLIDGSLGSGGLYDQDVTIAAACNVSKPFKPALMLYFLVRALKPANILELGTNVGMSSAFMAAALKFNGASGKITTMDASPYRQRVAKEVHGNLGLENVSYVVGNFTDTLHGTLQSAGPIDLAFIDGHHQYQPTLDYFDEIWKSAAPGAVFIFDDIRWSDGMERAWAEIQADKRLGLIVDLSSVGLGVGARESSSEPVILPRIRTAYR